MTKIEVAPFLIVRDTREQNPFRFENIVLRKRGKKIPVIVEVVRRKLGTGDYSIDGLEDQIIIERKSSKDLIQTISQDRERFEKELDRMQDFDWSCVLVEKEWREVLLDCEIETSYNPVSLDASILTFQMRYPKVHWVFRPNVYTAAKTCFKILELYNRKFANNE